MTTTQLDVNDITKRFGDIVAVDDVSFEIEEGNFVSILGPSGSGKSTILRMIAGFENPTEGDIEINGVSIVDKPPFERDVNMVFQHLALFPHLTVQGNIEYGLKNQDVPKDERRKRVDEMLEMVQLSGYNDRDPSELSGGEQQRVALARAIVNEPEIVLFDEPLASLDRNLRQHMQVELQRIQDETGITFLYVTHDQEVALAVSDLLVLLNEGEVEQVATPKDIYEGPESRFVAEFIGDINTIDGHLSKQSSGVTFEAGNRNFEFSRELLPADGDQDVTADGEVSMGIRPHSLELVHTKNGNPNLVEVTVENRIYQGDDVRYQLSSPFGQMTAVVEDESFQIGDTIYAQWDTDGVHLFPHEKGESASSHE